MMEITTWEQLIDKPNTNKIVLAEIKPAEQLSGFSLTGGQSNTYEISYLLETITTADSSTETIRKEISSVTEDGVLLGVQGSIANVESSAGSYWHDTANSTFYIHPVGSDDPSDHTILGFFPVYFGTGGVYLNNAYWQPYIPKDGIPSISQNNPHIHWGISKVSVGKLSLNNERGFFDQIADKFIWVSKEIILRVGGESLPWSEYKRLFTGEVTTTRFNRRRWEVTINSNAFDLLSKSLPPNVFLTADFANLDPAAEGKPIPLAYGTFDVDIAPIVTAINIAHTGSTLIQFQIHDPGMGAIGSITQVYVDYQGGDGWETIAHGNEDLTNGRFTISNSAPSAYVMGTTKVKVAFTGIQDGGNNIDGAPEVCEDLLTNIIGYASSALNPTSFTDSKVESDVALNIYLDRKADALSVIEKIASSDLAFFDEDEDGLLRYRTWSPTIDTSATKVKDCDFLSNRVPEVTSDITNLFWKIRVGYAYRQSTGIMLYVESSSDDSRYRYEKTEELVQDTYLRSSSDATVIAQRMNLVTKDPSPNLSIQMKIQLIEKSLGNQLRVTMARAPSASAGYTDRYFEIYDIRKSCFPFHMEISARDLGEYVGKVGYWVEADAPAWGVASDSEKNTSGFWCDSEGRADSGDASSNNVSIWW